MRRAAFLAAAGLLLSCYCCMPAAAAQADAPLIPGENGGWRQGRATFYGGPQRFLQNFADRGPPPEYGFGDAIFGSCGYTQQVPFPTPHLPQPLETHLTDICSSTCMLTHALAEERGVCGACATTFCGFAWYADACMGQLRSAGGVWCVRRITRRA
jgi:hypothetical protein